MSRNRFGGLLLFTLSLCMVSFAQQQDQWKQHVSAAERGRANPESQRPDSVAAGAKLYEQYCARCHGADANGRGRKPGLRGADTTSATDGDLFWLLTNGDRAHGMPAWQQMPEPERWQLIAYLRSLAVPAP